MSFITLVRNNARVALTAVPLADGMFRRHVWTRLHFPEIEMRVINALPRGTFDVAVDVGAAQGLFTWILSRKSRSVYAFEPGKMLGRLMRSATLLSNVTFQQQAVGDERRCVSLFTPQSGVFGATVSQSNPATKSSRVAVDQVLQVTLDEALAEPLGSGRSVDFLKIDVEGYELNVLRGSDRLIDRCHPVVLCEIERRHNPQTAEVLDHLRNAGYRCYVIRGATLVPFDEADVTALQRDRTDETLEYINNFLFLHPMSRAAVVGLLGNALEVVRRRTAVGTAQARNSSELSP